MQPAQLDSETRAAVRQTIRTFVNAEVRPFAEGLDEAEQFAEEIFRKMAELNLFGVTAPVELGGAGLDVRTYAVIMEELSRGYSSVADQCGLVELVSTLLVQQGTAQQQQEYLHPLLRAERRCAYAITEAGAGSDVAAIKTTAVRDGAGWLLNGSKLWINNATVADFAVVLARTDPDAGRRGMSIFLVDASSDGFSVGRHERKMGQRGSQIGGLFFDNVKLSAKALLGTEGRGFHTMMSVLDKGRVGIAALAVGILQAALEASVSYAKEREQFGKRIAEFQAVQWMIADMSKDTHAARLLVADAAERIDLGIDASQQCSMAKCFASDAAVTHTSNAVQIYGGSGYIRGFEVERLYRDAKITQIYEGTNQIQRMIIARKALA